ncbi:TPA: T9SS type A sorting domain-containing protein [bacterium]|nr:T9SS type A sorting domain-containing protein [bacterium]
MRYIFLILILMLIADVSEAGINKLDPILRPLLLDDKDKYLCAPSQVLQFRDDSYSEPTINTIIRVSGDSASLRRTGAKIRSVVDDLITADVPVNSLKKLIELPNVLYIQSARKLEICKESDTMLDKSVPDTSANQVWNGKPNYTGRDVLVAVIDTGIDWKHPAFMGADGKTRILYIWDQTIHNNRKFPIGFMYGTEWTKADIDSGICTEIDSASHGTHVASTIAGDERKSNGFTGMAPEANLIIIKSNFYDADVIDAVKYILNKADILGKPVVINMSFGSNWGPHDGTEYLDQALDRLINRPRQAIVASAGNSGGRNIHVGTRALRQSVSNNYQWVAIRPLIGAEFVPMEVWYNPADRLSVRLLIPKNKNGDLSDFDVGWINTGESKSFIIPEGPLKGAEVLIDASFLASEFLYPNFNNIYIYLSKNGNLCIPIDDYVFAVEFDGAGVGFNAYLPYYAIFTKDIPVSAVFPNKSYLMEGDGNYSVISPSSASKIISVGSYVSRSEWIDSENRIRDDGLKINSISAFSSRGPLINGVLKPEIAGPGQMVVAGFSSDSWDRARYIYQDGAHVAWNGTSMSAPHVTGAIALMFEQNPNMDIFEIRERLFSSAIDQGPVGWDSAWGYGKLNVLGAMNIPAMPKGFNANVSDKIIKLNWQLNEEKDVIGYKIYSSLGEVISVDNVNSIEIINPANNTPITFSISAYNSFGNESQRTNEIKIIPTMMPDIPKGLNLTAINEAILLKWEANIEYDIDGYKIYYGNSSGNYDKFIDVGNVNEYIIKNLPNGQRVYIAITAYNKSKNESPKSNEVSEIPSLSIKSGFRYQSGFPKKLDQDIYSSPAIYDIDDDGKMEIAIATKDGRISLLRSNGSYVTGFPISIGNYTMSSPAICDIDGDGLVDIIACIGNEVYVWNQDGSRLLGFPKAVNGNIVASPAIGDIDGDGEMEIVIGSLDNNIYAFKRDGSYVKGFPFATNGSIRSSASIGDINGDRIAEIVIGSNDDNLYVINCRNPIIDISTFKLGSDIASSPIIADIDSDGRMEIIANTINGRVYVLNADGSYQRGFPIDIADRISGSPALGNIDNDTSSLEIAICTNNGLVYAIKNDGSIMDGFPVPIMDIVSSSPAIADINGDGNNEIIIASNTGLGYTGLVYALNRFGKKIDSRFPIAVDGNITTSSPAIADLDGDGDIEIIVGSCRYYDGSGGYLHVWDLEGRLSENNEQWLQYRYNSCHNGTIKSKIPPSAVEDYENKDILQNDDETQLKFALYQNYPNPFNAETWIPYELSSAEKVIIQIYDVNGKLIKTLDLGIKSAGSYLTKKSAGYWNGKDDNGYDVSSGIYFCVLKAGGFKVIKKMILVK